MIRIVLDTNVLLSGLFFGGPPGEILQAWRGGLIQIVVSTEILEEYWQTGERLAEKYRHVDLEPFLRLVAIRSRLVDPVVLEEQVCIDPDDDKFLACAVALDCEFVISGDKALVEVEEYRGVNILTPREFVDQHLPARGPSS
ncbi:MAG TPA: putative toxin-antitoxin system toxin component, PIN family [Acidobacteriota bacterium]|nr:putative toxin-antitoxin system toxin component, PIN family [Acidobacteriota bacterium]